VKHPFISEELRQKRRRAGRLGGYATSSRYGREKMRDWGKLGGRPESLTLAELESQSRTSSAAQINFEGGRTSDDLKKLKRLYLSRMSSGGTKKEGELASPQLAGSPLEV
jgi:hypothetical protein